MAPKPRHLIGVAAAFGVFALLVAVKPEVSVQGQVYEAGSGGGGVLLALALAGVAGAGVWLLLGGKDFLGSLRGLWTTVRGKLAIQPTAAGDARVVLDLYRAKRFDLLSKKAELDDEIAKALPAASPAVSE